MAFLVCLGGGYGYLTVHEGLHYALWLNEQGITAFVLNYRLGSNGCRHPIMLQGARWAMRLVRSNADPWGIDHSRIGIIGTSAGGHLAATYLTRFDGGKPDSSDPVERMGCRPDFGILCYPVISMEPITHAGSKKNLLGEYPDPILIECLSNEKQVTEDTPHTFLFHTVEDTSVPVENSIEFALALRRKGVSFSLHI